MSAGVTLKEPIVRVVPAGPKDGLFLYSVYSVFSNLDFARGIFVLFLLDKGMSTGQIGILQTLLFWSNLLAEIPAGLLADKYKRKYSVGFGLFSLTLAATGYIYFDSFWAFAVIFVLHGMGFAFQSGADTALLYDNLKAQGPEWSSRYLSISARMRNLGTFAMAIAILGGGYLKSLGWAWVYGCFALAMILACLAVLSIREHPVAPTEDSEDGSEFACKGSLLQNLKTFTTHQKGKSLLLFIFGMAFIEAMHAPFFIYVQILLKDYGMSTADIALIVAGSLLLTSFSYLLIHKLPDWKLRKQVNVAAILTFSMISVFLVKPVIMLAIPLYFLIETIPSLLFVYTDKHINDSIPSTIRASFLSIQSFVTSIFVSVAFLTCGFMMEKYQSHLVLGTLCVLPLLSVITLSIYFRQQGKEAAQ